MRTLHALLLAVTACASAVGCARRTTLPPDHIAQIRSIAHRAIDDHGIVGLSIGIAIDGRTVFAEGFGHADLARQHPATADTIYDIASVGKQFTAAAVLRLAEQQRLSLDDRIRRFVPAAPDHFPDATISELLHHTSGFVGGDLDELNPPPGLDQPRTGLAVLDDAELHEGRTVFAPSETWVYANPNYLLLGVAIEQASGKPYPDYIQSELLRPAGILGMTVGDRADPPLMSGSFNKSDEGTSAVPLIHMSVYAGQGSVCSSVTDLLRWQRALDDFRIISAESIDFMRSPAIVHGTHASATIPYGTAIRLGSFHGHPKLGHTGTYDGGSAVLANYPDARLTMTVLTNTNGKDIPHALALEAEIAALLLDVDPAASPSPQPIPANLARRIQGHYRGGYNIEAAVEDDQLLVKYNGNTVGRENMAPDQTFRNPDRPGEVSWFLADGDAAGWWLLQRHGFLWDVVRRDAPHSNEPSNGHAP
ncbi:MAG: serine hydrolase domain-containing protein [Phycisphaerales bacterium JB037]